ncbi:MAG: hypothetical protein COA66_05800 [Arcobacter sp.]|nr:MAG: hypothetical protein COA66_05800 [Arcobacter sp.]
MKEIIKRLEIIKSSIIIEDNEIVDLQVKKLLLLKIDNKVESILYLISNTNFEKVIALIDDYLNQFRSLVIYEDEKIQGLKHELSILEKEFLLYSNKVEEYHNIINDFNIKYHKKLGDLIEEILVLREEYYEHVSKENENFKEEYKESKKDYEDFHNEFKQFSYANSIDLSKEDKKELKRLYKKASRLCHPDILEDEKKEEAEEIFKELNAAYEQKDIKKVSNILHQLLSGESFISASDSLFDKKILKRKISMLREKIRKIKIEITSLKENETFIMLNKIDDIYDYFVKMQEELLAEKDSIMEKIKNFLQKH